MATPRILTIAFAAVGLGLTLGACSGDDALEPVGSSAATTAPPESSSPDTTTTTTIVVTTTVAGAPAQWCVRAAEVRDLADEFGRLVAVDPDVVRTAVSALHDAVADASEVAPPELADAVATQLEFAEQLGEVLAATDYDMLTADLTILDIHETDMEAARDAIRAYNVEFCGFDEEVPEEPADGDDVVGFDFGDGSLRDQFVAQLVDDGFTQDEAECIFGEIDFSDPESYSDDASVTEMFVACDIDLARIDELLEGDGR